jgi:hypothetical protein
MHCHSRLIALGILLAAMLTACGKGAPDNSGSMAGRATGRHATVRQLKPSELTPAERQYGIAPIPDSSVIYQPDVIIVGGGAESIRGQSTNGFIWTIDAQARHANELAPGKVMFVTSRAVGRVLDVRRDGDNLAVTVGPVDLTDVVKEADIEIKSLPIDFNEAITHTSPDMPGQEIPLAHAPSAEAAAMPAMLMRMANERTPMPAPEPDWDVSKLVNFKKTPIFGSNGVGLRIASDGGGLRVNAMATVGLRQPTLDVTIKIRASGVQEASISLGGTAGLTWQFGVGTDLGRSANVKGILEPDTDLSLPIGGLAALPISVNVRQRFLIRTALGARNSTLTAKGDYSFTGGLKAGYSNGRWQMTGPTSVKTEESLLDNTGGISIAAAGVDMAHVFRVTVGIGAGGFTVGPYVSFTSSIGIFKGSSLGIVPCAEATLVMSLSGGVGYTLPKIVTKIINTFLSFVGVKQEIEAQGSLAPSPSVKLHQSTSTLKGCRAGSG